MPCAHVRRALWRLLCRVSQALELFFEDYILFILAIELPGGITTSGVVPYPYIREVTMGCDLDPIWKLHSLSAALSLYSIFHGMAEYYVMHRVFRGGANNVGESFDLEVL